MGSCSLKMLLLLLLPLLLTLVEGHPLQQARTPQWANVCNGSYLFSEDKKTWDDAGGICLLFGSHLLQIDNMVENFCLLEYAQKQGVTESNWWHSGNDIEWEGVFRQADGNLLPWQPLWPGNNPDQGRSANCLGVCLLGDDFAGKWFDNPCTNNLNYICERN